MLLSEAREILLKNFPQSNVRAQFAQDWSGPFQLPSKIETYYSEIGPVELEIWGYGNPWFIPSLAGLWEFQAGYRYDPETEERFLDWKDNWLVVAYDGADPYIFDTESEIILHDLHGQGVWNPKPLFRDLSEMVSVFAILGGIGTRAADNLTNDTGVRPEHLQEAELLMQPILGNRQRTISILERLGWR